MNNIGDLKTFSVGAAPAGANVYTYVWKWWDDTVDVTKEPTIAKQLNLGGANLPVSCTYCDQFGSYDVLTTAITVNAPPIIVGNPVITNNDELFPFTTSCSSVFYDPDNVIGPGIIWYDGATVLGAGVTIPVSPGTYQNSFTGISVTANRTLTQVITDVDGGVTRLDYYLRGSAADSLTGGGSSISNSIISTTNNLPEMIIGPGQEAIFTVYAYDLNSGQLQFDWNFSTGNGWSTAYVVTETPAQLANGSYRSQVTRSVASESPGLKSAVYLVTNLTTGQQIAGTNVVQLDPSLPPVISGIQTDAPLVSGAYKLPRDSYVHFTGTATDQGNLLLTYRWDFWQPNGVQLWGRTIMLRPDQYAVFDQDALVLNGPQTIQGQLTVTNRYGAIASAPISSHVNVAVWPL